MGQVTVIAAKTGAETGKKQFSALGYRWIIASADNLAGAETAPIFFESGTTWVPVNDLDGNTIALTATMPSVGLVGGRRYAFNKDVTAGSCSVNVDTGPDAAQ